MPTTVRLRALQPLRGDYGSVVPGQEFTTTPDMAEWLAGRGWVEYIRERRVDFGRMFAGIDLSDHGAQFAAKARKAGRPKPTTLL